MLTEQASAMMSRPSHPGAQIGQFRSAQGAPWANQSGVPNDGAVRELSPSVDHAVLSTVDGKHRQPLGGHAVGRKPGSVADGRSPADALGDRDVPDRGVTGCPTGSLQELRRISSGMIRGMREQRAWPMRYQVTITSGLGQIRKLDVLTWLGPEKAIAMAAQADGHGYGSPDGIYDIDVRELGPAERDERGVAVTEGYLSDRMEF
jgi:hypothetical protein